MAPTASLQIVERCNNSPTTTHPPITLGVVRASSVSSNASSDSHSSSSSSSATQPSSPRTAPISENTERLTPPLIQLPLQSVSSPSCSPSLTPSAASSHSPTSTAPSNGTPSTISTYQRSNTDSPPPVDTLSQKIRRWLHIRTWWQGSIAMFTLVIGLIGLIYSAYRSYNLARWTAAKDFYEECQNEKAANNTITQDCDIALSMRLLPPPYVHNDFFTNLYKRWTRRDIENHHTNIDLCSDNETDTVASSCPRADIFVNSTDASNSFTLALPAATAQAGAPWTIGDLARCDLTSKPVYMTCLFITVCTILLVVSRILRRSRVVQSNPVRSAGPIRMIRGTPDAQPNGLRQRPREISLQEFQDRDYGRQITDDEWDNNLNFGTDELQDHVFEHPDVDSIRRTENEMTKRVFLNGENMAQHGDTRKSWITRWREMRKRYKMSDIGRSSASPDAHGSRGHGVYELEQLKVTKPGNETDGVIVGDLIKVSTPTLEHAINVIPTDHKDDVECSKKPKKKLKIKDGATHLGIAQVGADMAATLGGGVMKQALIDKSDAKGDVLMPQDPQDVI